MPLASMGTAPGWIVRETAVVATSLVRGVGRRPRLVDKERGPIGVANEGVGKRDEEAEIGVEYRGGCFKLATHEDEKRGVANVAGERAGGRDGVDCPAEGAEGRGVDCIADGPGGRDVDCLLECAGGREGVDCLAKGAEERDGGGCLTAATWCKGGI